MFPNILEFWEQVVHVWVFLIFLVVAVVLFTVILSINTFFVELSWGVCVVGTGCFGDRVGAGDDLLMEVGACHIVSQWEIYVVI